MADQIEQMGVNLENQLKQHEELQSRYDHQVHQCSDLTCKLDATQKHLNQTTSLLANAEEELRQCKYTINERDFIICEQKKAERSLAHQACVLRAQLEKSLHENASLFLKIAREDKLSADNRSLVSNWINLIRITSQLDQRQLGPSQMFQARGQLSHYVPCLWRLF